jgi:23S rRNA (uracil1939-C5)-methyltransferase
LKAAREIANSFSEPAVTETVTVARLGHRGDGIADTPAGPAFIPYTLPGETVAVEASDDSDRRKLLSVETASAERVEPVCPHFGVCGGCALQHWALSRQLDWKRGLVIEALRQAGIEANVTQTRDAHGEGRRRAVLHARRHNDVLQVGYMAPRAHHIVPIDRCPILSPAMDGSIAAAWSIAEALSPLKKPLDIQFTATPNGLDIDVRGSGAHGAQPTAALAAAAAKHRLARITRHGELLAQNAPPEIAIGRAKVTLPPGAFLQATAAAEETLAALVTDHAAGAKQIADLFCGVGPFALRLAEKARITALDSDEAAIAALTRAAKTSGLKPVSAQARDLFRRALAGSELKAFDAVVFDPPRQGAQAQAKALAQSGVPVVIAVSCDAATFARDARILLDGGYRLDEVTPVDQFRYSPHVEIVARFVRR